ncbi:UNVERIFIED_CONTAM: hypothetical protein O8I53_05270 [Campylobacter lari]
MLKTSLKNFALNTSANVTSNTQKDTNQIVITILSALAVIIALVIIGVVSFFLIKKLLLNYYYKEAQKFIKTLKKFNTQQQATLARFTTLSSAKSQKYLKTKEKLSGISKEIADINRIIAPEYKQLVDSIKNKKFRDSSILFKSVKNHNRELLVKIKSFEDLSNELNKN